MTAPATGPMADSSVVLFNVALYWGLSVVMFGIMDMYARRNLGGKLTPAFQSLRMSKFISLVAVSIVSIVVGVIFMNGVQVKQSLMDFIGVPYFAMWFYYMVNVVRRVRAEKKKF